MSATVLMLSMALLSAFILLAVSLFYYRAYRKQYLAAWTGAIALESLSYLAALLAEQFGRNAATLGAELVSALAAASLLAWGMHLFHGRRMQRHHAFLLALSIPLAGLWLAANAAMRWPFVAFSLPVSMLIGGLVIWAGISLLRGVHQQKAAARVAGSLLVLWGLHNFNYPFLRLNDTVVPWAYATCALFSWVGAPSLLLAHMQQLWVRALQSEARFQQVLENLQLVAIQTNADLRLTFANRYFLHLTGYKSEEALGHDWFETFVPPERREELKQAWLAYAQGGEEQPPRTYEILTRSGERRLIRWHRTVMRGEDGVFTNVASIGEDITERQSEEIAREVRHAVAEAALVSRDLHELCGRIHEIVRRVMPAENFYLALRENDPDAVTFVYMEDEKNAYNTPYTRIRGHGITEYILRTGESFLAEPETLRQLRAQDQIAVSDREIPFVYLGVPLKDAAGHTVGVLCVQSYQPGVHYDEWAKQLLEFASSQIALVLLRARAEQEVQRQRDLYQKLLDTTQVAILHVDSQGRIASFNRYFEKLSGYSLEEAKGQQWADLLIPPEQREAMARSLTDILAGTSTVIPSHQCPIVTKEGGRKILEWAIVPLTDEQGSVVGALATGCDLTEKLAAEERLQQSERRYRLFAEHSQDAIVITDGNGHIAEWNASAERILGLKREEVLGRYLWDVQMECALPEKRHPDHAQEVATSVQQLLRTGTAPWANKLMQQTIQPPDGKQRIVQTIAFAIPTPRGHLAASIIRDVTELVQLEEQYRHAQRLESVGRLAGGIAHYFNNILTAILSYADFLRDALPEGQPRADLEALISSAQRAQQLTRQLLAHARRQVLEPQELDLNQLVQNTSSMLRALLRNNIAFETVLSPDLYPTRVDPNQIEQVLMNLVVNAYDAMPEGGTLRLQTTNVTLQEENTLGLAPGRYVLLTVSDTGMGMTSEVLQHLFEPFFTTKEVGKGTGLGLATAYGIVKQHGGEITVESEPGRGATFHVYLPAAQREGVSQN